MGTNFYLHSDECETCGRSAEPLHIGKSSIGWCFLLHVDEEVGIDNLADWCQIIGKKGSWIKDEYGDSISAGKMLEIIMLRSSRSSSYNKEPDHWYSSNHAEPGPNGLVRNKVDDNNCIGHGEGTWDLITGEFS